MTTRRRRAARATGSREANAIAANLGRELRRTRTRRRLTQAELGDKVAVSQAEISALEAGRGARTPIETWVAIGIALDRPIAIGFSRDVIDPLPQDAGHLAAQELLVRLATAAGWRARIELPSNPRDPAYATDVVLARLDGRLVFVEIWNRIDDPVTNVTIGSSVTLIGDSAFSYCTNLTSVTIGSGITTIGNYVFYRCQSLASVTIPNSVSTIGSSAFTGCFSLTSVHSAVTRDIFFTLFVAMCISGESHCRYR